MLKTAKLECSHRFSRANSRQARRFWGIEVHYRHGPTNQTWNCQLYGPGTTWTAAARVARSTRIHNRGGFVGFRLPRASNIDFGNAVSGQDTRN